MSLEVFFSLRRVADNDVMPAMNNNVNSCLKLAVFLGEITKTKNGKRDNKDVTEPGLWNIFRHDYWGVNITSHRSHKSYRPLTTLTFSLQNQMIEGITAKQYKVLNIFLHSTNTLLLYLLLRTFTRLTKSSNSRHLSFLTSGLFACHPVHVEPVVSIVGRADLLYFQKANTLGKQGNYEESEAMYLRAISLRNSGLYWSNLGVLYHRANKKEKAVSAYTTALLLDKNIQSARANLEKLQ